MAKKPAALAEYDEMRKKPGSYKRYSSFDDVVDEVFLMLEIVPSNLEKAHILIYSENNNQTI